MQVDSCREYRNIAYEANCSGLTKSSYSAKQREMVEGLESYPNFEVLRYAFQRSVPIIVGSDCHSPDKLGANVKEVLNRLKKKGINKVNYFEKRELQDFPLEAS